jgi:hypothetical protein
MMKTNLKPQLNPFARQTTTEYKFKAHVGKGGSVQTMPLTTNSFTKSSAPKRKNIKKS